MILKVSEHKEAIHILLMIKEAIHILWEKPTLNHQLYHIN